MMNHMWPDEILYRRFRPVEAAKLTGVDVDRQRIIAHRYHDFRMEAPSPDQHKRWYWAGVQGLLIYDEISKDLNDPKSALSALFENQDITSVLEFDFRFPEGGDLLIAKPFDEAKWGGTTNASSFARLFSFGNYDQRPKRAYIYNLSDMQRRLAAKANIPEFSYAEAVGD